jgi:AraC family transcriptional regulator, regulatory protein of adaptative response / methylated-DNA-[protein]-cysteine methyltransferase
VKTTGVYCRPSCGARLACPENVQFYSTPEEAEKAGFRPCKRCKPKQLASATENAAKIAKTCRLIERSEKTLPLKKLAGSVEMSVFHFHRTFKSITGLTPAAYATTYRNRFIPREEKPDVARARIKWIWHIGRHDEDSRLYFGSR